MKFAKCVLSDFLKVSLFFALVSVSLMNAQQPASSSAVAAFVFTPVTVPNAIIFNFFAPNDKGQIPLGTTIGSGIWENGNFTLLPAPPTGIAYVSALGINNDGTIVGAAFTPDGIEEGFILTGSTYSLFSRSGWDGTEPRFIASSGLVTGFSFATVGPSAGFVYDPATGKFTDATPPGSDTTIVQGMNKFGVLSGSGWDAASGFYGITWQQGKFANGRGSVSFFDRFTVANQPASARGINDAGVIVGYTHDGKSGFVGNQVLGFRLIHVPGSTASTNTVCEGINNLGQMTCAYYSANFSEHVFIVTTRHRRHE